MAGDIGDLGIGIQRAEIRAEQMERCQRSEVGGQISDFPVSRFQISVFDFASQLWSEDFTAKLFCNVEFWLECLPKLIGHFLGAAIEIRSSGLQGKYTISHS